MGIAERHSPHVLVTVVTKMWRGVATLLVGSVWFFSGRCTATRKGEELAIAPRKRSTPLAEARRNSEVKPDLQMAIEAGSEWAPRVEEAEDPGVRIEEMEENWTKQASTPAAPGAMLKNARSVYSELSDEILVGAAFLLSTCFYSLFSFFAERMLPRPYQQICQ